MNQQFNNNAAQQLLQLTSKLHPLPYSASSAAKKYRVHIEDGIGYCHKVYSIVKPAPREKDDIELKYDEIRSTLQKQGLRGRQLRNGVTKEMTRLFANKDEVVALLIKKDREEATKLHNKVKRLRRCVEMNSRRLKYFLTVTMGPQFENEKEFEKTLYTLFKNLKVRSRETYDDFWIFCGKIEHGTINERAHWHGFICIPDGDHRGTLGTRRQYSTKRHKWEEVQTLPYIEDRIGFTEIERIYGNQDRRRVVSYISKYISKEEGQYFYSRGISGEAVLDMNIEDFLYSEQKKFGTVYRAFDDVDVEDIVAKLRRERYKKQQLEEELNSYAILLSDSTPYMRQTG